MGEGDSGVLKQLNTNNFLKYNQLVNFMAVHYIHIHGMHLQCYSICNCADDHFPQCSARFYSMTSLQTS